MVKRLLVKQVYLSNSETVFGATITVSVYLWVIAMKEYST